MNTFLFTNLTAQVFCKFSALVVISFLFAGCVATTPTVQAPEDQRQLTREVQTMLAEKGFDPGPADGIAGKKTERALAQFQQSRGLARSDGITKEAYRQLAYDRQGSQRASVAQPAASREAQEDARRRQLSRNDPRVEFRTSCPGLYIPEVFTMKYRGAVPAYAMRVLNNSQNRYSVKYDLVYTESQRNVLGKFGGQITKERHFTIRPGQYSQFMLIEVNRGAGSKITGIEAIDVFECHGS